MLNTFVFLKKKRLTSHNSHLNWIDSNVMNLASNQYLSISDQLKYGVRGFMLDIDWKECSVLQKLFTTCNCEKICLCHGQCGGGVLYSATFKDGFSIKNFDYALKKIVKFLKHNPNEIITIFLEDYIKEVYLLQNIFDQIDSFNELVFNPYAPEWNVIENGWPTIKRMIKENKRLVIVDDEQRGIHYKQLPGFIRSRDFLIQNHFEWFNDMYEWDVSDFIHLMNHKNVTTFELPNKNGFHLFKLNIFQN
jgi:hypothetical protein